MDIRLLEPANITGLIRKGWIPAYFRDKADELYIFGSYDEEQLIGTAVFTDSLAKKFTVNLKHIYIHRDYRNQGYAAELFSQSEEKFISIGIREIDCECMVEKENVLLRHRLMHSLGFEPEYLDKRTLKFAKGHFVGQKSDLLFDNIKRSGISIETIENYSDRRLLAFWEEREKTGIYIAREEYDSRFCAFGVINGVIEAALCMKPLEGRNLVTEGYYASDLVKNKDQLLPFMLSYIVKNKSIENRQELEFDNVYVVFRKNYRVEAIENTFGKAADECYSQRYKKKID